MLLRTKPEAEAESHGGKRTAYLHVTAEPGTIHVDFAIQTNLPADRRITYRIALGRERKELIWSQIQGGTFSGGITGTPLQNRVDLMDLVRPGDLVRLSYTFGDTADPTAEPKSEGAIYAIVSGVRTEPPPEKPRPQPKFHGTIIPLK